MWLNRIEIDAFGKFNKFSIDLSKGFQVIHGGNEDGKTTLMDFIKLILYSKAENARSLQNPRRKYVPFSGRTPAGALLVERGGSQYVIQKTIGDTPGKDRARIVNLKTGREEPPRHQETGVWFTGLDAEGFEQICFVENVGRMNAPVGSNAEEQTIANLTGAGDKRVSRLVILKRLTDAKEALVSKSGKNGYLADMRAHLQRLNDEKAKADYAFQKQAAFTAEYEALQKRYLEQRKLKTLVESIGARDNIAKTEKLLVLLKNRSKTQAMLSRRNIPAERIDEYIQRLRQTSDEYDSAKKIMEEWLSESGGNTGFSIIQDEDMKQYEALEQRMIGLESEMDALPKRRSYRFALPMTLRIPIMILIAAAAVIAAVNYGPWYLALLALMPLVFISVGREDPKNGAKQEAPVIGMEAAGARDSDNTPKHSKRRKVDPRQEAFSKQIEVVRAQVVQILKKYGCENSEQLRERYIMWKSHAKNLETQSRLEIKLKAGTSRFIALAELYEPTGTPTDAQKLLERLSLARQEVDKQNEAITELAQTLGFATENPSEISARLAAIKVQVSSALAGNDPESVLQRWETVKDEDIGSQMLELQKKLITPYYTPDQLEDEIKAAASDAADAALYYKALDSAIDVINESADDLRAGFGLELNRRAGLILSDLTHGQYTDILVAKDYSISIKSDAQYREYEYFSSGAIDQAYLALRLALSDMTAGQGEPFPMLLDDSLMQYDDARLRSALQYLNRRTGQTILFTCHKHITEAARELGTRIASIHESRPV